MPTFGHPGTPAATAHKEPGMIFLTKKFCSHPGGCVKAASFGPQGARHHSAILTRSPAWSAPL